MYKIMIVDDSSTCIKIIETFLQMQDASFAIFKARNGQEALDIINDQNEDFDLIFVDIKMPIIDGYEFAKLYQGKAILVALTATHPMHFKKKVGIFDKIMNKPISLNEFTDFLKSSLTQKTLS